MCDRANSTEVLAIAQLPVGLSDAVNYGLELVFDRPQISKVMFSYNYYYVMGNPQG
ncbi:MAG: hypothetical protein MUE44_12200 [Oscillatoriaceae cyanobacterium Prado104]|jgi:hypothetical protein|nr:hypothetical protein [Oscillatoriaceae cyanobacterium Prado104]